MKDRQCNMKLFKTFIPVGMDPSLHSFSTLQDDVFHFYHLCELEATACNVSLKNKGKLIYSNPKNTVALVLEGMAKISALH